MLPDPPALRPVRAPDSASALDVGARLAALERLEDPSSYLRAAKALLMDLLYQAETPSEFCRIAKLIGAVHADLAASGE